MATVKQSTDDRWKKITTPGSRNVEHRKNKQKYQDQEFNFSQITVLYGRKLPQKNALFVISQKNSTHECPKNDESCQKCKKMDILQKLVLEDKDN